MTVDVSGVLDSDTILSRGVMSLVFEAVTVGDRRVKGWWNPLDQPLGVAGMVGNGYDGVRKGCEADVEGTLPRMVFADSVDSVEVVCPVASGLQNEASSVGDKHEDVSSLIGDTLRVPRAAGLFPVLAASVRVHCCFCIIFA